MSIYFLLAFVGVGIGIGIDYLPLYLRSNRAINKLNKTTSFLLVMPTIVRKLQNSTGRAGGLEGDVEM